MDPLSDDVSYESDPVGDFPWRRPADAQIADVAGGQEGVISWEQLRNCGLTPKAIRHRVAVGRLHVLHYKVYAVGHDRLTREARCLAAILAASGEAALSHEAAAALWGIRPSSGRVIDVTCRTWQRKQPGVRFHTAPF